LLWKTSKKPTRSITTAIHTNPVANARDGIEMASAKPTLTRLETRAVEEDSRSGFFDGKK